MEDFAAQMMAIVVPAGVAIIGSLIAWGLKELNTFIRSKTKNEAIQGAMDQISEVTLSVVHDLEKTTRKAAEDGRLTPEEAKELRQVAVAKVKTMAPKAVTVATKGGMDYMDDYIGGKVEQMVQVTKRMKAS